jgi:hypothetical protein
MDDAASNVTQRIVEGHHMAIANHELAAGRQAGRCRLRFREAWP